MKRISFLIIAAAFLLSACQQTPAPVPVDQDAENAAITETLDKLYSAVNEKDADALASLLTDDLLCCGTDPAEFWNKQEIVGQWSQMFAQMDSAQQLEIRLISDRKIRLSADGKSAIVVEQFMMPVFTPDIPWRNVYHVVKDQEGWMIDFFSSALIPNNEDLPRLNKAMMEE